MKKVSFFIVLTLILAVLFTGCGILNKSGVIPSSEPGSATNSMKGMEGDFEVDLIAGQEILVGKVLVWDDDEKLCVKYQLSPEAILDGWRITETHLAVADSEEGIPQNKQGIPIPGKFPYGDDELGNEEFYEECISFSELGIKCSDVLIIAAHAVIEKEECELMSDEELCTICKESAWSDGIRFVQDSNWAMYFEYQVSSYYEHYLQIGLETIEKAIDLTEQYGKAQAYQMIVDYLLEREGISSAGVNPSGECVWYQLENGFTFSFSEYPEEEEETLSLEKTSPAKTQSFIRNLSRATPDNNKAIILDWEVGWPSTIYAKNIEALLKNAGYTVDFYSKSKDEFTIEKLQSLYQYGVVYISSHGYAGVFEGIPYKKQLIVTGQIADIDVMNYYRGLYGFDQANLMIGEHIFYKDKEETIVIARYFCFYPEFIHYFADQPYPESLIYADVCEGLGTDGIDVNDMADAFIDEGAYVYCSWIGTTLAGCMTDLNVFKNLINDGMNIHHAILYSGGLGYCSGIDFYPEDHGDFYLVNGGTGPVHNLTKNSYYNTIQAAIDLADSGDIVEVSPGIYYENINFLGKNITLQSADPDNPSVVASTIIDGGGNGSVVTFISGETAQAELSGFTIQNGYPGTETGGGGIFIISSSPVISNNIVKGNITHSDHGGGGIFIAHSASPLIEDNTIDGNQGGFGGGIYVGYDSSPTIRNNTIENNLAEIHRGGGIFISGSSSPTIQDNSLSDNSSQYGGGICIVESSSGEISNNYFTLNAAQYGGGIFCGEDADPIIKQNEFYENSATGFGGGLFIGECVVNNNVISGNTAQTGGGIFVWESSPTISDNTISGNTTTMSGGGIYLRSNSHPTINNNIISLNTTNRDGGGLYIDDSSSVKTTNGSTWPRQNTPPNAEATNTYFGNTHGNPLDYTEGADVYMVGAITPPPDVESPTVITVKVDNITQTSARLYGNITDTGGENADQRGFAIHDLTEGIVLSPILEDGSFSIGEYNLTVSGLTSGHLYQFAAYAKNSHGSDSGDWIKFTAATILVQAEITNIRSSSGDLIDPFEFDKWYTAVVYISMDYNGLDSGIIEVKPKPDSGIEYDPNVKEFPYNKYTLGGSRGFDYQFVGSGTTRQLTFELYDQTTGIKLDEYTSETLNLMQPDPNLDYIESVPSSTTLEYLHPFNFPQDYVIKAHFDDGHIETWTDFNKFNFESSDIYIVNVHENYGSMYGTGVGTATITITYKEDTSKKAYLSVTVYRE